MNVSNGKCIRQLSVKSMQTAKGRNRVAIMAIALTTLLFTILFTVLLSMNDSFQQANFRQAGGYAHASFKSLTVEQMDLLKRDSLIKEYGVRRLVGTTTKAPLHKSQVEIKYRDMNAAKWEYVTPQVGTLPSEDSNEAAADTKVLSLLGITPQIGAEFTMTFEVDGNTATETFVLSGWWEHDEAMEVNHVMLPQSRAESILKKMDSKGSDGMTGFWNLDVMFKSSMQIEQNIQQVLANGGFQNENPDAAGYINTGVNWGYTGTQLANEMDITVAIMIILALFLIFFTGYLIIYNVFQISIANDIRHYGLLKVIGTTGRQIKRIIRFQALRLSAVGIPIGLLLGYGMGVILLPIIVKQLEGLQMGKASANPIIFIVSALFSLVTVFISCHKPGRTAAKVSPVAAMNYVGLNSGKKNVRKANSGASLLKMALANLGRNRKKTLLTMISLSLAVVLLNLTVTFTGSFDMDKYLKNMVADYIAADVGYFQVSTIWDKSMALSEEVIEEINTQEGIVDSGRVYGSTTAAQEFLSEESFRKVAGVWQPPEVVEAMIEQAEQTVNGELAQAIQLYGMEDFALSKLNILDGDLTKLQNPEERYIAAVYFGDDYDNVQEDTHWAKVGDIVTIRHIEEFEYYDFTTREILDEIPEDGRGYGSRAKKYQDIEYEVAALVMVPRAFSYRFYSSQEYIMNAQTFIEDTNSKDVLLYAFDVAKETTGVMDSFMQEFTENVNPQIEYESKQTYMDNFKSFRNMFLILGGVLSGIIGIVGVLNFMNAMTAGMLSRRKEFAVLQSIGMTGKQLKKMLIFEGLYYTLGAILLSLLVSLALAPFSSVLENIFWFLSYHFTVFSIIVVAPIFILLGSILPLILYHFIEKNSIIERLRGIEQ